MADKKKPNYFRITSPRRNKWFWALVSALAMTGGMGLIICIAQLISYAVSEPGMDIGSIFMGFDLFMELLFSAFLLIFIVFGTVVMYNYIMNREKAIETKEIAQTESPLLGVAKDHEQAIIEMLKSIAKPEQGTNKLNRANTIHFLRTLKELGLFDTALDGQHQKAWVEQVTGYEEKSISAFNQALDKQKENPKLVAEYRKQLEQIIAE